MRPASSAALAAVLSLVLLASSARAVDRFVNPDGICGGSAPCYTTVQAAIDASFPGDVIRLDPGVHSPAAKIDVHTSVTIVGVNEGINPLPSQGTVRTPGVGESIIDGAAAGLSGLMVITADDVVLDGIEFRNGSGDLIDSETAIATSGTIIRNCIVHDSSGDEGIQLRNVAGPLVECNYVYNTAGDGINNCCGVTDAIIRYNELRDIASGDAAIYVYDHTNSRIEGNLIDGTVTNDGIKFGNKGGGDAAGGGGAVYNNTVRNTIQDGIAIYSSDVTVECNEVTGSVSENGGIYVAFAVSNVVITGNYVHDNNFNLGKWGDPAGVLIGTAPNLATISVNGNNLENNAPNGVTNKAAGTLDATGNWWGAPDGPSGAGAGSGDAVSTAVDFSVWLGSPASPNCPTVGTCGGPTPVREVSWGSLKSRYR